LLGEVSTTASGVTKTVSIYDDATGLWSQDSLSLGRFALAGAAVGNIAVFAGVIKTLHLSTTNRVEYF